MAGKKNAKKPAKGKKKAIDWDAIREDYLIQNLDQSRDKPYTISGCAKTWGLSRSAVENHAKKEEWREELITRAKAQANANLERRTETIAQVEREARKRHANFMKGLISKAALKFNSIEDPAKDLTVDQMLKMLQFALPEERAALGIPKYLSITTTTPTDTEREMETPGMRIERRRLEREVKKELLALIARAEEEDDEAA
jgi:hypothetical protein